ncbi:MAG TPA: pitrilysin family protein [Chthoniobacter sp.]|jgi:zinc protease
MDLASGTTWHNADGESGKPETPLPFTAFLATFPLTLRSLRFVSLLVFAALAVIGRATESIPPLKFEQRTLPNGLQLVWLEDHSSPTVAIQIWYKVGSKDDPPGRSGFAHLFEHIMFKSTKHMPSEFFDRLTEDVGGENNAYTADDVTVFHETVPSNNLERLLWAEAERLRDLTVDVHNFMLERNVVEEEYRQRVLAEPYGEFGEFIQKKSFAEHPYKRPTIGNIEELEASSLGEVRAFHTTFYRPDNAVLVVVGDFEPAQLQGWVDQYFGTIPKPAEPIPRVTTKEPPRTAPQTITEYDARVPLPALAVTYLGPSITAPDAASLRIAEEVLGGGESSRLYQKLVYETQLAQSAEFSADLRQDLGLLTFEIILSSGAPIEKVKKVLFEEIAKISAAPITGAELTIARNQLLASKLLERETFEGKAETLAEAAAVYGDTNRANTDLADLQAVTPAQVQEACKKWFQNPLIIDYLPEAMKAKGKGKK